MSLSLFLVDDVPPSGLFELEGTEGHHAADVARLRVGERVLLGDGAGTTAAAEVAAVSRGTVRFALMEREYADPPRPRIVIAQGIPKGDRGELAVQAMTEVGVDEIVPWAASRCVTIWKGERGLRSRDKWAATAREAAKQSRRAWLPVVAEAAVTTKALARRVTYVLHEEATVPLTTVGLPSGDGDIVLVVGPEGGISDKEMAAFIEAGAVPVRLGDTVLRTSTAGVAAASILSMRLGRW